MSHELEIKEDGKASMAYAGLKPWHNLGKEVPADLTPVQMLKAAGLDWTVSKTPTYTKLPTGANGELVEHALKKSALVRNSDNRVLDVVSNDWNTIQNLEAFEFFHEFVMAGDMEMHTAGSLKGGQIVWGLAKVKESFEAVKGDQVDSHLLFTNFHKFGFATDVRFTPIRVVCNNTLTMSLSAKAERLVKISHRTEFKPDDVKVMLGIAHEKLAKYKDMSQFLASKMANDETALEYFVRVFPKTTGKSGISKNASTALGIVETQPGFEYAPKSFWQLFNSVTYLTDHTLGTSADSRLRSSWYGFNRDLKEKALSTALEMAKAS